MEVFNIITGIATIISGICSIISIAILSTLSNQVKNMGNKNTTHTQQNYGRDNTNSITTNITKEHK